MFKKILYLVFVSSIILNAKNENDMLKIAYIDDPPYKEKWIFWGENHLRIKIEIINLSDSSFVFEKITPSGDNGNPTVIIKQKNSNENVIRNNPVAFDYLYDDSFFVELKPNQVYKDTVDLEILYNLYFENDKTYEIWFEYESRFKDYKFKDEKKNYIIWKKRLVSNILELIL